MKNKQEQIIDDLAKSIEALVDCFLSTPRLSYELSDKQLAKLYDISVNMNNIIKDNYR